MLIISNGFNWQSESILCKSSNLICVSSIMTIFGAKFLVICQKFKHHLSKLIHSINWQNRIHVEGIFESHNFGLSSNWFSSTQRKKNGKCSSATVSQKPHMARIAHAQSIPIRNSRCNWQSIRKEQYPCGFMVIVIIHAIVGV